MKLVEPKYSNVKQASKEASLDSIIREMIAEGRWSMGERLPSERVLSAELKVSRNTLRNVLKCLEANGLLEIRKSSGCYVSSTRPEESKIQRESTAPHQEIMAKYEAGLLVLPGIFAAAALKVKPEDLQELEVCTGALGQSILERDWEDLMAHSLEFPLIVVRCLNNSVVSEIIRELCESAYVFVPHLSRSQEASRKSLFTDFVMVLKALRKGDPALARIAVKRKIINAAHALTSVTGVPLTPILVAAHEELSKLEGDTSIGATA